MVKASEDKIQKILTVRTIIGFSFMFAVIILLSLLLSHVRSESYECTQNPLLYGVQNLDWISGCTCDSASEKCECFPTQNDYSQFTVTKVGILPRSPFTP